MLVEQITIFVKSEKIFLSSETARQNEAQTAVGGQTQNFDEMRVTLDAMTFHMSRRKRIS
jgi:hypothetical protein